MLLSRLFKGAPDIDIKQLSTDSRVPMTDAIFFCMEGIKYDGHDYIDEAIRNGAKVIVYSEDISVPDNRVLMIKVRDVPEVIRQTADIFYDHPNSGVQKFVIAGNYGRSSVASFIYYYLNRISSCGYVGVLGIRYKDFYLHSNYPSLSLLDNLKALNTMKRNKVAACTFEASASALNLHKLDSVDADTFIYTCTDPESSEFRTSDYYRNLRNYMYSLDGDSRIVLNIDDESYKQIEDCIASSISYGTSTIADYQIRDISLSRRGISYKIIHDDKSYTVEAMLQGLSSVYNLTAAIAALHANGEKMEDLISVFKSVPCVEGVMERVDDEYDVIVDCAYDIKSIEDACRYARQAANKHKAIGVISINYTDGDKRLERIMNIAEQYLDIIILTENESLQGEVMQILKRCDRFTSSGRVIHAPFRSIAIENAIEIMNSKDVLLILGKGNEKFLMMGLGKEKYNGDRYYACKYLDKRRREEDY